LHEECCGTCWRYWSSWSRELAVALIDAVDR
jgi:hypothetical protein